jgi:hypothetical protein
MLPNGHKIDPLELHRAMRMATGAIVPIDPDRGLELVRLAIVSKAGIESYCERIGVEPPRKSKSLQAALRRVLARPRHVGPPDCPNSILTLTRLESRASAIDTINILKSLLKQRQRLDGAVSNRTRDLWNSNYDHAQRNPDVTEYPELQQQLADLTREWESLKAVEETSNEPIPQADQPIGVRSGPKKRGIGRPPGAGSFESEDMELVEEMRSDLLSGKHTSITAAARERVSQAAGGGTEASKEKRLATRYSERYPG